MRRTPIASFPAGDSAVFRLQPMVKLICFALILAAAIASDSLLGCLIWAVAFTAIVYIAALPFKAVFRPLWLTAGLPVLVFALYLCFYPTQNVWAHWHGLAPSLAGMIHGASSAARLLFCILSFNILVMCASPLELSQALGVLLSPLCRAGVSAEGLFRKVSACVSFLPLLAEEIGEIRQAQALRGGSYAGMSLKEQNGETLDLLRSARDGALRRCGELADSMEVRGFGAEKDCVLGIVSRPGLEDLSALTVCLGLLGLEIVVLGNGANIM